jgi:hypothetical protein
MFCVDIVHVVVPFLGGQATRVLGLNRVFRLAAMRFFTRGEMGVATLLDRVESTRWPLPDWAAGVPLVVDGARERYRKLPWQMQHAQLERKVCLHPDANLVAIWVGTLEGRVGWLPDAVKFAATPAVLRAVLGHLPHPASPETVDALLEGYAGARRCRADPECLAMVRAALPEALRAGLEAPHTLQPARHATKFVAASDDADSLPALLGRPDVSAGEVLRQLLAAHSGAALVAFFDAHPRLPVVPPETEALLLGKILGSLKWMQKDAALQLLTRSKFSRLELDGRIRAAHIAVAAGLNQRDLDVADAAIGWATTCLTADSGTRFHGWGELEHRTADVVQMELLKAIPASPTATDYLVRRGVQALGGAKAGPIVLRLHGSLGRNEVVPIARDKALMSAALDAVERSPEYFRPLVKDNRRAVRLLAEAAVHWVQSAGQSGRAVTMLGKLFRKDKKLTATVVEVAAVAPLGQLDNVLALRTGHS